MDFDTNEKSISQGQELTYVMIYLTAADSEQCGRTKVVPCSHRIVRAHLLQNPDGPRNKALCDDVLIFDYSLAHSPGGQQKSTPRVTLRTGFHNGKGALANELAKIQLIFFLNSFLLNDN